MAAAAQLTSLPALLASIQPVQCGISVRCRAATTLYRGQAEGYQTTTHVLPVAHEGLGQRQLRRTLADPEYAWLRAQLHPAKNGDLPPEAILVGSTRKLWWQCGGCISCGRIHEWEAPVSNRRDSSGRPASGCPYCPGRRGRGGKVCICQTVAASARLLQEWDWEGNVGIRPEMLALGSEKKVAWRCLAFEDHPPYVATVGHRARGSGCPRCAIQKRIGSRKRPDETSTSKTDSSGGTS